MDSSDHDQPRAVDEQQTIRPVVVQMSRRTLYAPLEPYDHGFLVRGGHEIYYEQCGNPHGKPALFVHGGPGGGGDENARRFFDPQAYRIVNLDQRGAGRSRPFASLENNTTWDLVADIEALRAKLEIERWLVFGGSWGSTLSLAYAESHPGAVSELVLRGIFLLRRSELDWFYQDGANRLFPDYWQEFLEPIPATERDDMLAAYHRRLSGDDESVRHAAARAWSVWEGATSSLLANAELVEHFSDPGFALALARIETHYFVNGGFLESEAQLLDGVAEIRHIPAVIVQGRYDAVCPMRSAWDLAQRWPEADFRIVPDAGHSAYEAGITHELITATDAFADAGAGASRT
jgi:proline iminopeptidase